MMTTKRPLPPPQSRHVVQREAKRGREVIDLCEDAGDARPIAKKAKTESEIDGLGGGKGTSKGSSRGARNTCFSARTRRRTSRGRATATRACTGGPRCW